MRKVNFTVPAVFLLIIVSTLLTCSDDPSSPEETISRPATPTGDDEVSPQESKTYTTGGAVSNLGHTVAYRFDLDADGSHNFTIWSAFDTVAASWPDSGLYVVKAQARCATHTTRASEWSDGKQVAVAVEYVTAPYQPSGATHTWPTIPKTYCTGGAASSRGHAVEYQFDWDATGAGDTTVWDTTTCLAHSWPSAGTYEVKARARCATHTEIVSLWSSGAVISVTEVTQLPTIHFATHIDGVSKPYVHNEIPQDTVGMFKPFSISYHGSTVNGSIEAYQFFPLTPGIIIPGANVWTTDLQDTTRHFSNTGGDALPSDEFRLAAQCRDEALAESPINAGTYAEGVCQVVVNFDPDTEIWTTARNSYVVGGVNYVRDIDFADGIPDTVPFRSWVTLFYTGWDDFRDSLLCSPIDPDRCIDFQYRYAAERHTDEIDYSEASSWLPRGGVHDTDPFSASDSTTFSVGSFESDLFARAIDEHGRPDGTPPGVSLVGNFEPTMDSVAVEDHFGHRLNLAVVDTVQWNFWKGEGWPYTNRTDTLDFDRMMFYKTFSFNIKGWGHDHPLDPTGSGVKAWRYSCKNSSGNDVNIGKAGAGFFDGPAVDVLDDRVRITFYYPLTDSTGDEVFANLPSWFDEDLTVTLVGRDTSVSEPEYYQWIFLNGVKTLFNVLPSAPMGRRTEEKVFTFQVRLTR